jgi:glycosyltransferase involved in cell wall biosynthesis
MKPLVSIITPTYNHENYIADCIKSVLHQSYENWEMIIINDGSTDNTLSKANFAKGGDSRIKILDQKNVGIFRLKETYNKALLESKGKYIAILEGDDVWEAKKLEIQVADLELNPDCVLSWGRATLVSEYLDKVYSITPIDNEGCLKLYNNDPIGSIFQILYFECCIPALTIVLRKDKLIKIGGFQQNYNLPLVDMPTTFQMANEGKFIFNDSILGSWRIYSNQVTKTYTPDIYKGFLCLSISEAQKRRETEVVLDRIRKKFEEYILISYARVGRYLLIKRKFSEARKNYLIAIFMKSKPLFIWRLRAIVGFVFSIFRLDVEGLAKIMGKKTYS